MTRYDLSNAALQDLDEIWNYIAQDNSDAADRWIGRLLDACEKLVLNPRIGHTRAELTDKDVLFWPVEHYLIIYRIQPDCIDVLAVTQGARDIPSFLRQRKE